MGSSEKDKSAKKAETKESDDTVMNGEPPVWAWQLKHDIEEVRKIEVKVDALAMALKEIKQVISDSGLGSGSVNDTGQASGSKYETGVSTGMGIGDGSGSGSGGGSGGASGAGSSSGKVQELIIYDDDKKAKYESPSSTTSHEFISDDIDVSKASKRAKAMGTVEGGLYEGTTDKRGFVAFRRMIMDTPEVEFGPDTEQQYAFVFFYITSNVQPAIKTLITNTCRKKGDPNFKKRLTTAWDVLRSYSDLSDELSLSSRWESLSCNGPYDLLQYISDLEVLRDQLTFQRGYELSDVEVRGRLYGGLPKEAQKSIDNLPKGSCDTYEMMVEEAKKWGRLEVKYEEPKTTTMKPKATPKTPTIRKTGSQKKTINNAEINAIESSMLVEDGTMKRRRVYVEGFPNWWSFVDIRSFVQKVLNKSCRVFVKMLSRRGVATLSFEEYDDAGSFMEMIRTSTVQGADRVKARFDRYEMPPSAYMKADEQEQVDPQLNAIDTTTVDNPEDNSDKDSGVSECNNGVLSSGDMSSSVTIDSDNNDDLKLCDNVQLLSTTNTGLPKLKVHVGSERLMLNALLDSGATDVFMSSQCFDELSRADPTLSLESCSHAVKMVNGLQCILRGVVRNMYLCPIGGIEQHMDAYVLNQCNHDIILPRKSLGKCIWIMKEDGNEMILFGDKANDILEGSIPSLDDLNLKYDHQMELHMTEKVENPLPESGNGGDGACKRVVVSIPWKTSARPTPNFNMIKNRMSNVFRRLSEDSSKWDAYNKAVTELLLSGAVEVMDVNDDPQRFASFYTAITPVINESRVSTKCRLCLDARPLNSYTNTKGVEDADIIPREVDLYASILRWRAMEWASCEDVCKAFWQIEISEMDQRYLGMIVLPNIIARWVRVPFGCGWSPWALSYGIQVAVNDIENAEIKASLDYYVDDLCISGTSKAKVDEYRKAILPALERRGFLANPKKRVHNLDTEEDSIGISVYCNDISDIDGTHTWLGYRWLVDKTIDVIDIKKPSLKLNTPLTMTNLRSVLARLFDPLGLWNEITLEFRSILRGLHDKGFGVRKKNVIYKDVIDKDEAKIVREKVKACNDFIESNRLLPARYVDMTDIVTFVDASSYAMSVDCRSRDNGSRIFSRLSTHSGGTIPRRELEALRMGVLSVRQLTNSINNRISVYRCVIVSDSMITLYRVRHVLLFHDASSKMEKLGKPEQRRLNHIYDLVYSLLQENRCMILEFRHSASTWNVADRLTRPCSLLCDDDIDWSSVTNHFQNETLMHFEVSFDSLDTDVLKVTDTIEEDDDLLFTVTNSPECAIANVDDSSPWFYEFKRRVQVAQSGDPECVHVSSLLRSNSSCSQSRFYRIDEANGLLLTREFKNDGPDCWVVVIPDGPLQEEVVDKIHKEYIHPGVKKTVQLIRRLCDFKGLYTLVKKFIRSCDICCRAREGQTIVKGISTPKTVVPVIFGAVGLDLYGPIQTNNGVKIWLLVMVCYVSKWMAIKVLDSADVEGVLTASVELFYESGVPVMVLTDQGSVFMSKKYRSFLKEHGIHHAYTFPYEETRRGWLERPHKEIGSMLRCLQSETGRKLQDLSINEVRIWVSRLCFIHNNMMFEESTNGQDLSPWLCNRVTRGLDEVLLADYESEVTRIREWLSSGICLDDCSDILVETIKELRKEWSTSIDKVKQIWLERRGETRRRLARSRKSDDLKIKDVVWKRNMPVKKLGELFSGPYEVYDRKGSTIYLKDLKDGKKSSCSIEMLKKGRRARPKPVKEPYMKTVGVQVQDEDPNKIINPDDVRRLTESLTNDTGVMTRSRKRLLDTVSKMTDANKIARTK